MPRKIQKTDVLFPVLFSRQKKYFALKILPMSDKLILTNIAELKTPLGKKLLRGEEMKKLLNLKNAYIKISGNTIEETGEMSRLTEIPDSYKILDCTGKAVIPGFVDSHTHLVFPAPRVEEFKWKLQGMSYQEIAEKGGGILNTAKKTARVSEEELYEKAYDFAMKMLRLGTTVLEIKSGYGLYPEQELKLLRVAKKLKENLPQKVFTTCLALHALPEEFKTNRQKYIDLINRELLPRVAEEKLADFVDVFCETGFFSVEESRSVLRTALNLGMQIKIHANELDYSGGVQLGAELGAVSVDHLECVGNEEIKALKNSRVVPTLLPATSFFLHIPHAPARKMIREGLGIALASDFNPGTSPTGNMQIVSAIAGTQLRLLPEEVLTATTLNAAAALADAENTGSLEAGKEARLLVLSTDNPDFITYHFGFDWVEKVIIGTKIYEK